MFRVGKVTTSFRVFFSLYLAKSLMARDFFSFGGNTNPERRRAV